MFCVPPTGKLVVPRVRGRLSIWPLPLGDGIFFRQGSFLGTLPGPSRFLLLRGQGLCVNSINVKVSLLAWSKKSKISKKANKNNDYNWFWKKKFVLITLGYIMYWENVRFVICYFQWRVPTWIMRLTYWILTCCVFFTVDGGGPRLL